MSEIKAMTRAEGEMLADYLRSMPADAWDSGTACNPWTVRHLVAHLTALGNQTMGNFARGIVRARFDFERLSHVFQARAVQPAWCVDVRAFPPSSRRESKLLSSRSMPADLATRFEGLLLGGEGDVNAFYRDARNESPIFWSEAFNGWVVSKYEDAYRVLHDEEYFGPLSGGGGSTVIHGRTILHMEGIEHRRKSAILAKCLRSKPLLEGPQRDYVLELGAELLDAIGSEELCDLRQDFAMPLPLRVTAWIMGIQEAPNFRQMYDEIAAGGGQNMSGDPEVHARAVAARERLTDFVTPLIAERRANPGDDLLSVLCSTEYEGERLSDDEIRSFCSFLLAAGIETTDRGLSSLLKKLFAEPELWDRLRADRSLVPSAVAESIRWAPPVCLLARGVLQATELQGQKLEAGEKIVMLLASANRDEDQWDQPETYVIDRFTDNEEAQYGVRAKVLSFGHGRHLCTGSLLARMEMVEGLHMLLDRFEGAEFTDGVPPEQGFVFRSPEHVRVCPHAASAANG